MYLKHIGLYIKISSFLFVDFVRMCVCEYVCVCVCVCVCVHSVMSDSRQESWSELPFPTPGDLPNPGIKPTSLM